MEGSGFGLQPFAAIVRAVPLYLLMLASRGEPEKVLMFPQFFVGGFGGLMRTH